MLLVNKIKEYLLYILIFLLPWQTRWIIQAGELNSGYWEYGAYSLYITDIVLIVLLGLSLFTRAQVKKLAKIWWLVAGLEFIVFLSVFVATDKWLAFYGYGRFLLAIGLFFLVINIKYDKIKLYWSLVAAGVIQALVGLQQFFAQQIYANKWLGIAAQDPVSLGVSVVEVGLYRWLRAFGSLPHPNILGGFLVVCLLIAILLYFGLYHKLLQAKANEFKIIGIQMVLSMASFVIILVGLLLSFSRSAWLAWLVAFIFLFIIATIKYKKTGLFIMTKFSIILIIVTALIVWTLPEPFLQRVHSAQIITSKSATERIVYNNEAVQLIKNNWLLGVGVKNYTLAVHDEIDDSREVYNYQPVHNMWLLVLAEIGVIGLILFISLLVYGFINLFKAKSFGKFSILLAMVVIMMLDHWLWSLPFGLYIFWLVLGLSWQKS